jgi:hypothetical protein
MAAEKSRAPISHGIRDLERKLRSIGIVKWDGRNLHATLRRAVAIITKQLSNPHVGLYRREYLLKLRNQFREKITNIPPPQIVSGGLPSLGKRR